MRARSIIAASIELEYYNFKTVYAYFGKVSAWNYSICKCGPSAPLKSTLENKEIQLQVTPLGTTTYSTALAVHFTFSNRDLWRRFLLVLPPLGEGPEAEDVFILQEFFGIATKLPEPDWVKRLNLPGQSEIAKEILGNRDALARIQKEISEGEDRLVACKRWYRLLYDDGHSLESIVKEALEIIGASVTKTSTEKDDFRVEVPGFSEGVMEVKGTHNAKFTKGALRQLAGWMDEANAEKNVAVKGIFLGNSARNEDPRSRGELFEKNIEAYARIKDIVILRAMDLYCLSILKRLDLLDSAAFWNEFFASKGAFEATKYWAMLPKEYQLPPFERSGPAPV